MYIFISLALKNFTCGTLLSVTYGQRAVCNKSKIASIYRSGAYRELLPNLIAPL